MQMSMLVEFRLAKPWNSACEYGQAVLHCYLEMLMKRVSKGTDTQAFLLRPVVSTRAVSTFRMGSGNCGCIFGYYNDSGHADWYLVAGGQDWQMCGTVPQKKEMVLPNFQMSFRALMWVKNLFTII